MIDAEQIIAEVRANKAKLDACTLHNFERIEPKVFSKHRCTKCGGTVDVMAVHWYNKGLEHGKDAGS